MTLSLKTIDPFPYMFKSSFDFGWVHVKEEIEAEIERSQKIIEEVGGVDTPEKGGGTTSVILRNDIHNIFGEEFHKHIDGMLSHVWDQWHLDMGRTRYISESWINKHPPRGRTAEHHHQNVQMAVACYLNVPENSGNLMIQNPLQIYKMGEPLNYNYYDEGMDWMEIPVKTNDVLFFPGWLKHKTAVNRSLEDRYIMSLNIMGRIEFNP